MESGRHPNDAKEVGMGFKNRSIFVLLRVLETLIPAGTVQRGKCGCVTEHAEALVHARYGV